MDASNVNPNIKHGIFTWKIENFLLCLTQTNYTAESTTFILGNSIWSLKLIVEMKIGIEMSFTVQLCRGENDNPRELDTRFLISLKSTENVLASTEVVYTFTKETMAAIMPLDITWKKFFSVYGNDDDDDTLVIECDIISIKGYSKSNFSDDLKWLSENLMALRDMKESHNAYLVTEDTNIPVHKEILCAHSPVFEEQFQSFGSRLDIHYSPDVVESMLRFLYSGNIGQTLIDGSLPPIDLYKCAVEYGIYGLMKCLNPWKMNIVSVIECQKIKFVFECPRFSKLITKKNPHFRRKISDDLEVVIYFDYNDRSGKMSFKIKLRRSGDFETVSISGIFYILDLKSGKRFRTQYVFPFDGNKECSFDFAIEMRELFTTDIILPKDVLKMQCEFKLGHSDQSRSGVLSDIEYLTSSTEYPDDRICSLTEGMENLFRSQIYADLRLIANSKEMYLHKSVLSACSPVFRDVLIENNSDCIQVDCPVEVAEQLMFYMYTGKLTSDYSDFESLYRAAEKYNISRLKDKCVAELKHNSSHENVFSKYSFTFPRS